MGLHAHEGVVMIDPKSIKSIEVKLDGVPLTALDGQMDKIDAAELIERLGKLNRHQRRSIIARARKQARGRHA